MVQVADVHHKTNLLKPATLDLNALSIAITKCSKMFAFYNPDKLAVYSLERRLTWKKKLLLTSFHLVLVGQCIYTWYVSYT